MGQSKTGASVQLWNQCAGSKFNERFVLSESQMILFTVSSKESTLHRLHHKLNKNCSCSLSSVYLDTTCMFYLMLKWVIWSNIKCFKCAFYIWTVNSNLPPEIFHQSPDIQVTRCLTSDLLSSSPLHFTSRSTVDRHSLLASCSARSFIGCCGCFMTLPTLRRRPTVVTWW